MKKNNRAMRLLRSMVAAIFSTALFAISTGVTANGQPGRTGVVHLKEGPIRGLIHKGVEVFLGIPFAAPPVGDLRWRPPQSPARWHKPYDAVTFGNTCVQTNTFGVFAAVSDKEDCLYLNVFAPGAHGYHEKHRHGSRPVMVWIHGGGLFDGESNDYDGSKLARDGDAVVVTINYRLNIFGFLGHPALDAEGHDAVNYGLMDQQYALKWVQRNIRAFGGDPNNVTIFGESAGGTAVLFNMISPTAAGLFHRAIIHSPAFQPTQANQATSQARGVQLATLLGCTDQTAACMRAASVQDIIAKAPALVGGGPIRALDGKILTINMGEAIATGQFNKVPTIIGNNRDEQTWFIGITELASGVPLTAAGYPAQIGGGANNAAILAQYPLSNYPNPSEALAAARTDSGFACGTRRGLKLLTQHVPTWAYEFFDRTAPFYFPPVSFTYGAAHTLEIQYLFPLFKGASGVANPLNNAQERLSDNMVSYWTTFAKGGDPNSHHTPYWASYKTDRDNYQSLQLPRPVKTLEFSSIHKCDFWDSLQ